MAASVKASSAVHAAAAAVTRAAVAVKPFVIVTLGQRIVDVRVGKFLLDIISRTSTLSDHTDPVCPQYPPVSAAIADTTVSPVAATCAVTSYAAIFRDIAFERIAGGRLEIVPSSPRARTR